MPGEGDPRAGTSGATPFRWDRRSDLPGGGAEVPPPDLMAELRARTQEALGSLVGAGTEPAGGQPTVEVPLMLVERLVATLSEARLALADQRAQAGEGMNAAAGPTAADVEMARMVVLNMALNGAPRAEAEQYLARNFALADPAGIVADAYDRVPDILSRPRASEPGAEAGAGLDDDRQSA